MSRDADDGGYPFLPEEPTPRPRPPVEPERAPPSDPTTFRPAPRKKATANKSRTVEWERRPVPSGPGWMEWLLFGRVSSGQLARFCRQFAAYLDAGVDINKALTSLEVQFKRTALGPVIGRLRAGVRQGDSLAETVAREPQAFDSLFVSMINVAEARGGIPETFHRLSEHYEARQSLIRLARSAMIYPLTVVIVASGAIAVITIFVLPKFVDMLRDIAPRTTLPLPSRLLMGFSEFISGAGWWLVPVLAFGFLFAAYRTYRTRPGKRIMDELALYVPVLGQFLRKIDTSRFARTLSVLMSSGVDVGTSLDLTAGVMQLDPFRRALLRARKQVLDGDELSEAIDDQKRFSVDVVAILNSGEETGKLPEALNRLADDYEEQVTYMVKNMGQLIQPVLIVFLGGIVLFIILAVIMAYISLLTSLAGGAGS
jgi:type IV pilus assembly protein PilC